MIAPLFGPADFGNVVMLCQGVKMAIEILDSVFVCL